MVVARDTGPARATVLRQVVRPGEANRPAPRAGEAMVIVARQAGVQHRQILATTTDSRTEADPLAVRAVIKATDQRRTAVSWPRVSYPDGKGQLTSCSITCSFKINGMIH